MAHSQVDLHGKDGGSIWTRRPTPTSKNGLGICHVLNNAHPTYLYSIFGSVDNNTNPQCM